MIYKTIIIVIFSITVVLLSFAMASAENLNIKLTKHETNQINSYSKKFSKYKNVKKRLKENKNLFFYIQKQLNQANLPEDFVWLAVIESGFNPKTKHGNHLGLWQHSPYTGKIFGGKKSSSKKLFDPIYSTEITIKYLNKLKQEFNNNHRLMIYAYNYGSPRIHQLIKKHGPNFSSKYLPNITKAHIYKLFAAKKVFSNEL